MASFEEKYKRQRYQTAYNTTIFSITMVLFLLGLLAVMAFQAQKLSTYFRENIGITAVIKEASSKADILLFKAELDTLPFVKSTLFITKQEAAKKLQFELGEDFVKFIGYNPLPNTLKIFLSEDYTTGKNLESFLSFLQSQALVENIEFEKSLIELIDRNVSRISAGILSFSALLLLISILLIYNTIRLTIYSKRMLIKSMLLVGATQGFIRRPFIVKGIFQGLISGAICIGLLLFVLIIIQQKIPELDLSEDPAILAIIAFSILAFGTLVTWLSNFFAVKKYLKLNSEDLY